MEPSSSVMRSAVAVIQASNNVLLSCYRLRGRFEHHEHDIDAIIDQVEALSEVSEDLKDNLELSPSPGERDGGSSLTPCGVIFGSCNVVLQELTEKLQPLAKSRLQNRVAWPFESADLDDKISTIQKQKTALELCLSSCKEKLPNKQHAQVDFTQSQAQNAEVLRWYKSCDSEQNHTLARESHEPSTGAWILQDDEFRQWKTATGRLLWVHGIPGAGKTILCSTIIDHMKEYCSERSGGRAYCHRTVYFYFDFSDAAKQSVTSLLSSAIFQLISSDLGVSEAAASLFKTKDGGLSEPTAEELLDVFLAEVTRTDTTFLVIDALDECPKQERAKFFDQVLKQVLVQNVNVLITSREEPDIVERGKQDPASPIIRIRNAVVDEDVRKHVRSIMSGHPILMTLRPALQKEILDSIVSGARGMFRWAICQLETVKDCLTPEMIRQKLDAMPPTLDETYDRILRAVPAANQPFVQAALHWLAFSARPMLLEELAEAVIIRPQAGRFDAESSRLLSHTMILDLCGALVTSTSTTLHHDNTPPWLNVKGEIETRGSRNFTNRSHVTVISLSHYTVKEYLVSPRTRTGDLFCYYASEKLGNSFIAQCCLLYMLDFNKGNIAADLDFNSHPLLEYCARYWMKHWILAGGEECDAQLGLFYKRLFQPQSRGAYTNWLNIWNPDFQWTTSRWGSYGSTKRSADLFPQPLYWIASLGDLAFAKSLVDQGADATAREGYFESPFGAAVFGGHMKIVEYFLSIGLDPNIRVVGFGSLLQIAIEGGSMAVVRRLIEAGADVNSRGGRFGTPLIAAASKQRDDIVALLIKKGAELNLDPQPEGSALYRAAEAADIKLATMLLGAGCDVNGSEAAGEPPPLYAAAKSGCLTLVNMFIRKGADVNMGGKSLDYGYPLLVAAYKGHSQIVRTLLMAGADANLKSHRHGTALEQAITRRDVASFHALLDAGADINACGHLSVNCFHRAIECGQFDMAKILMQRGAGLMDDILVDAVAVYKREPWVLDALLSKDVDIDVFSEYSGTSTTTPLHVAVMKRDGGEAVAKLILEKNPYVNAIDQCNYSTPICLAVRDGMVSVARQLIDRGADVSRTIKHSPFEMAIMYACEEGGTLELAEMLLEAGVDINGDTHSAPFWPVDSRNSHVLLFLVRKGINLNRVMLPAGRLERGGIGYGVDKFTPIQHAAQRGDIQTLQLLLDLGADISSVPGKRGTTLHYGILSKDTKMVDFLLQNGARADDSTKACSIICKAIENGMEELVPTLIEAGGNVNTNEEGRSPLAAAFRAGKQHLVSLLRKYGAHFLSTDITFAVELVNKRPLDELKTALDYGLDPNIQTKWGESAVRSAALKGDTAAIQLLVEYGADLAKENFQGLLGQVCMGGDIEMATFMLDNGAADNVSHALERASGIANNVAMVDLLLCHGADIHQGGGDCFQSAGVVGCQKVLSRLLEEAMTPSQRWNYLGRALQASAWHGKLLCCTWLVDVQGADVNHHGLPYGSPLQASISLVGERELNNRLLLIKMLIDHGASVNPPVTTKPEPGPKPSFKWRKRDMSTTCAPPLSLAISSRSFGADLRLLSAELVALGADVNGVGGEYHTPLQAAAYCYPSFLSALLDAGADVNAMGGRFGTALHAAAWNHDVEAIQLLLSRGADARLSAGKYGSVLQAAARGNRYNRKNGADTVRVMEMLVAAGADVHARDGKYGSAVQMAALRGNVAALRWLEAHGADIRVKGGRWGNAYRAALKNTHTNKAVEWATVSWIEQHYGRDGWD